MNSISPPRKLEAILSPLRTYPHQEYKERLDRVILFGSQARGEATGKSDIDLLIVLKDSINVSEKIECTSQFITQLCLEHNVLKVFGLSLF